MSFTSDHYAEFYAAAKARRYAGDLKELLARADAEDDDQAGTILGELRPTWLHENANDLDRVFEGIEHISLEAQRLTGADPRIDGSEEDFIRLDAEHAWHVARFARAVAVKSAELLECAERLASAAEAGWQNTLDHEQATTA